MSALERIIDPHHIFLIRSWQHSNDETFKHIQLNYIASFSKHCCGKVFFYFDIHTFAEPAHHYI
ncbi:CLUMA_CG001234, isoform A [Clunio marinus]|uniref:CLUMA_CG001234, isoform A n=1 Tax=Clunio marinus TaxID=568069 RepID=A0A1J1HMH2_9DIPT|nr:CLUMA_CG001234, isoform A [Clunio marinus]